MVHVAVAVGGLTTLVALSEMILPFLQIIGGLFILWLALQAFHKTGQQVGMAPARSDRATFGAGFFACVTNPKAIVFFIAFFPAFISTDHSILLQGLIYGAVFIVLDAISILAYALFALGAVNRTGSRWLNVDILSSLGLAGVGIAMIVKGYRAIPSN